MAYNAFRDLYDAEEQAEVIAEIVASLKEQHEPDELFQVFTMLNFLGAHDVVLDAINLHQKKLYAHNAVELITLHLDLLISLKRLEQCLSVLNNYEQFPYFSQEANELITEYRELVHEKIKKSLKTEVRSKKEIEEALNDHDHEVKVGALNYILQNKEEPGLLALLELVLTNEEDTELKIAAIEMLIEEEYEGDLVIVRFGKKYNVNIPETRRAFYQTAMEFLTHIDDFEPVKKNMTYLEAMRSVAIYHLSYLLPELASIRDINLLVYYYYYYVLKLYGESMTLKAFSELHDLDYKALKRIHDFYKLDDFTI